MQLTELDILWSQFENTLELDLCIINLFVTGLWVVFLFFWIHLLSKFSAVLNEGKRKNVIFLNQSHIALCKPCLNVTINPCALSPWFWYCPPLLQAGWSPLHIAASAGRDEIVKALLGRGAQVNAVNQNGCTPLHYAASKNRHEVGFYS